MVAPPPEIVELNGVRIAIDPAIMAKRVRNLIRTGQLSEPEAGLVGGLVEDGERFLELGAGIGYTSSLVARRGKAASIATFEANPRLIASIRSTHELNGVEATVVNAVVLARKTADTVPFFVRKSFTASSLIEAGRDYASVVDVPVIPFDEVIARFSPTMLMIDIEGGEGSLFKDVELPGVNKVLLEMHKSLIGPDGVRRVLDFFAKRGFVRDPDCSVGQVVLFRRRGSGGRPRALAEATRMARMINRTGRRLLRSA